MMCGNRIARYLPWLAAASCAAACGKMPPPPPPQTFPPITIAAPVDARVRAALTIRASADANPDASGRASPVVVRVYQLRTDGAFSAAEFFALFDDAEKALGAELITRDEFVLAPGENRMLDVTFANDARFVGVLAAFRDVRNAQWRAVEPVPKANLTVSVERARVTVSPTSN
jgi:type VI secretion system protein VasD